MKKVLVLLLSLFVLVNIFAATGTIGNAVGGSSDATLKLTLNNEYRFAFIKAGDDGSAPSIGTCSETVLDEFNLTTKGDALTMSNTGTTLELDESKNIFYFFYQAYTNQAGLKIKISTPYSLAKDDDPSQKISYNAKLEIVSGKWDGDALSPTTITSETGTTYASANIRASATPEDFNYMGLCKVTIDSNEDLGKKKPGNYSARIYLTLTTT